MNLLLDMNLSPKWVSFLNHSGHQALHWSSIGDGKAEDAEIMEYAKNNDLVVLTHDLDFGAILAATNRQKPSVVQIRDEVATPDTIGHRVLIALNQMEQELSDGALLTIEPSRSRVRVLPINEGWRRNRCPNPTMN